MDRRWVVALVLIVAMLLGILLLRPDTTSPAPRREAPTTSTPERSILAETLDYEVSEADDHEPAHAEPEAPVSEAVEDCKARFAGLKRQSRKEIKGVINNASETLQSGENQEHLLAAAMIERSNDPERSLELLRQLGGENSANEVTVLAMMNVCERRDSLDCDFAAMENNIRINHSTNGALWLGLAGEMLRDDRPGEAIEAVRQAIVAPAFDTYLGEQIMTVERGLAASTNWSLSERVFHSVEYGLAAPPHIEQVVKRCEEESGGEWFVLCDLLADRMIANERDIIALGVGIELKRRFLAARQDSVGLDELEERKDQLAGVLGEPNDARAALNALLNDENLLRDFLENFEVTGEIDAFRQLSVDVDRLRETEGYDQCNFVANPFFDTDGP